MRCGDGSGVYRLGHKTTTPLSTPASVNFRHYPNRAATCQCSQIRLLLLSPVKLPFSLLSASLGAQSCIKHAVPAFNQGLAHQLQLVDQPFTKRICSIGSTSPFDSALIHRRPAGQLPVLVQEEEEEGGGLMCLPE